MTDVLKQAHAILKPMLARLYALLRFILAIDPRVIATALVSVGILHICATLASPHFVESSAYRQLSKVIPLHKMKILDPIRPDKQPLPYLSPDARYAMCRFDSTGGPVSLGAYLPEKGWTFSIHNPQGDNIYTATGRDARETTITVKVVASTNSFSGLTPQSKGLTTSREPIQIVEARTGIAIVRAPDRGEAYLRPLILALRKTTCKPFTE